MKDMKIKDSIEDFEAAFICINNSPNGYFETSEDLMRGKFFFYLAVHLSIFKSINKCYFQKALQGCGRNPSPKTVFDYWKKYKSKKNQTIRINLLIHFESFNFFLRNRFRRVYSNSKK